MGTAYTRVQVTPSAGYTLDGTFDYTLTLPGSLAGKTRYSDMTICSLQMSSSVMIWFFACFARNLLQARNNITQRSVIGAHATIEMRRYALDLLGLLQPVR